MACVFGYAAGCDLTRRDLQAKAKAQGAPWDAAKGFDASAPISEIAAGVDAVSMSSARLRTSVNGEIRQDDMLAAMIWSVPEIIAAISREFELRAGDLIFTGPPEGVGPLNIGDHVAIDIDGAPDLEFTIAT